MRYGHGVNSVLLAPNASILWGLILLLTAMSAYGQPASSATDRPWRLISALPLPRWLYVELEQRTRFEHLQNEFRPNASEHSTALSLRTLLSAGLRFDSIVVGAELQDARVYAAPGTPLNATLVNPFELLQIFVGLRRADVFTAGDFVNVMLGRLTLDIGSRRLTARNEFRNTINGFTGIDAQWTSATGSLLRAFATLPVSRLPSSPGALVANRVELDRERSDALFFGVFGASSSRDDRVSLECYALGLLEGDHSGTASTRRKLVTPGLRILRPPAVGQFDGSIEAMLQLGTSRVAAEAIDSSDLNHRAASIHVSAGYSFDVPLHPRLVLQYDYATGDENPTDGVNSRFDPLFGARRFEFGPTGLYGAFARSNINSPGLRLEVSMLQSLDVMVGQRLFWLASARDVWTAAGLRDSTGASGFYVGQQTEARIRWQVLPKNLSVELGATALVLGQFALSAPGAKTQSPLYFYTQFTGTI
jgi:Alginate export